MTKTSSAPLILPSNHPTSETCAPRADFTLLSQTLHNAPLLYPPRSRSRAVSDLRQAITAYRRHRSVSVYVSLSEKIGLPLALLLKARRIQTPQVLIAHHLTSPKKRALQERQGWLGRFTRIVVLSEPQAGYLRDEARYPEENLFLMRCSVDTDFWNSEGRISDEPPFVLSVGQERRDYQTLFEAARKNPSIPFAVAAESAWGSQTGSVSSPPSNVTIQPHLSYADLRSLYARSALVVVPLEPDTLYAAGATGLLESMAMGKSVVLTETLGLRGYTRPGEDSHSIPAANPEALARAIRQIYQSRDIAARLGDQARRSAEARYALPDYVAALAGVVRDAERER